MEIRQYIAKELERGKIDFNLWVERDMTAASTPINAEAVAAYAAQIKAISQAQGILLDGEGLWSILVRLPDTLSASAADEVSAEDWQMARQAVCEALAHLIASRRR